MQGTGITEHPHKAHMNNPQGSESKTGRASPRKKHHIPLKHKIRQYCTLGTGTDQGPGWIAGFRGGRQALMPLTLE